MNKTVAYCIAPMLLCAPLVLPVWAEPGGYLQNALAELESTGELAGTAPGNNSPPSSGEGLQSACDSVEPCLAPPGTALPQVHATQTQALPAQASPASQAAQILLTKPCSFFNTLQQDYWRAIGGGVQLTPIDSEYPSC